MFTTIDTPHEKVKTSQVKSEAPILRLRYYRKKTPGVTTGKNLFRLSTRPGRTRTTHYRTRWPLQAGCKGSGFREPKAPDSILFLCTVPP
jgi:hypothetical protein